MHYITCPVPVLIGAGGVTSANGVRSPFFICCQKPLPEAVLSIVLLPLGSAYPIAFLNCFPKEVKLVSVQVINLALGGCVR
jgi:hypothetical protein